MVNILSVLVNVRHEAADTAAKNPTNDITLIVSSKYAYTTFRFANVVRVLP